MHSPVLSVVVGTRNREESLQRFVRSVIAHTSCSFEIVISDASDVPVNLVGYDANIRVIPERPRLGCTRGFNVAFSNANGIWVIWGNDDCEVVPGYDTAAIRFMESHPEIGLGALYYQEGGRAFQVNAYFDMVYANFGILSRELGNQVGWFDSDFPMYGSDNSLAFRVLLAGKGVAGISDARIIHHATLDRHREENNDIQKRIRDAESLVAKYGARMTEMQETYRRNGGAVPGLNDQTPDWLKAQLPA